MNENQQKETKKETKSEVENTIIELENSLEGFKRFDEAQERISELSPGWYGSVWEHHPKTKRLRV